MSSGASPEPLAWEQKSNNHIEAGRYSISNGRDWQGNRHFLAWYGKEMIGNGSSSADMKALCERHRDIVGDKHAGE